VNPVIAVIFIKVNNQSTSDIDQTRKDSIAHIAKMAAKVKYALFTGLFLFWAKMYVQVKVLIVKAVSGIKT
jgi:hypothetical protein